MREVPQVNAEHLALRVFLELLGCPERVEPPAILDPMDRRDHPEELAPEVRVEDRVSPAHPVRGDIPERGETPV